jgi:RNA polymerase sigma factor (sigma-70 family)
MTRGNGDTQQLLGRWYEGDPEALHALLESELEYIRGRVRRRLGPFLRQKLESGDVVQEAVQLVLQYVPPFRLSDRSQFRALLSLIVENVLRDQNHWFSARRRELARERPIDQTVLVLDPPREMEPSTSHLAQKNEENALFRLAFEILGPEEKKVIWMHDHDQQPFARIGDQLGCSGSGARNRYLRAMLRFQNSLRALRQRQVHELLGRNGDVDAEDRKVESGELS